MRKFILVALAAIGIMLVVPEFASATPFNAASGLGAVADQVGTVEQARYRRWHRYRVVRYRVIRRCWHRRYHSGRRCW